MENKLKDDPNSLPIVEEKQDLTASYSSHDSMNVLIGSFSENNRLTNQIIIADSSLNETDAMINSANHQFENQSTLERITEDEPIDRQEKSRSLKIFNALHWASLGCLLGITFFTLIGWIYWIALMVIPVFALFVLLLVLSMIQKNTLSRKIPMEERGIQYKRRLLLSKIVIISSWVLLLSFLTLVLIAIIQLS